MSHQSHYRRSVLRRACVAAGALGLGGGLLAGTAILAAAVTITSTCHEALPFSDRFLIRFLLHSRL